MLSCLPNLYYVLCNAVSSLCPPELHRLNALHSIRKTLNTASFYAILINIITRKADSSSRAVQGVDLQPLAFWNLGSNPSRVMDVSLSVVFRHVEASAMGRSLVQKIPTECGVSEYDRKTSTMRRPWPTSCCCITGKNLI